MTLTDPHAGDELSYATTAGVTAAINPAQDTVTFAGTHSIADYQAALRAVRFFNGAGQASGEDRHVAFAVNDGEDDSPQATRTIDFTVDTNAPDSEITSGPSGDVSSDAAAFAFAATAANPGGTLRCRLDGPSTATGTYADCTSVKTYVDLADGGYTFRAFAVDAAGNEDASPATRSFTVDTVAPATTDNVPATAQAGAAAVTLSATDAGGSGVARTYYTTGASPADPTAASSVYDPASKPTLANGEFIKYFSADAAGNQEAVKRSLTMTVTSAPIVPPPPSNVIRGTAGNDTITGTAGDDVIYCGAGDDVVNGGPGNDVIDCGDGNDRVNGGAGDDLVFGRRGNDRLIGSTGMDSLTGGLGDDRLSGGTGKDRLRGNDGRDQLYGQAGNDRLSGGSGEDELIGAAGHDRLSGDAGDDRLWGGVGNDRLYGRTGDDRLSGGPGHDRLSGGAGADRLMGGAGVDRLIGGPGVDVLLGGPGADTEQQ